MVKRNRKRKLKIFIDILKNCDCEEKDELRTLMTDREGWKLIARWSSE